MSKKLRPAWLQEGDERPLDGEGLRRLRNEFKQDLTRVKDPAAREDIRRWIGEISWLIEKEGSNG